MQFWSAFQIFGTCSSALQPSFLFMLLAFLLLFSHSVSQFACWIAARALGNMTEATPIIVT